MSIYKSILTIGLCACALLGSDAEAKMKIDKAAIAELQKVAVVSVSFRRANLPDDILLEDEPEYVVMHEAGNYVLEIIGAGGNFEAIEPAKVVANPQYESLTDEISKFHGYNNYYPHGYRRIKLSKAKKEAAAFCEALGVDAVVQIRFTGHSESTSSGNVFSGTRTNTALVQTGEVTMIDKNGKVLISGKSSSGPIQAGSSRSVGSIEFDTSSSKPTGLHANLMSSYLGHLRQDLGLH